MLVSNFEVYLTKDGNGAIDFTVGNELRKIIIPKGDVVPKQVFDLYYGQLKSFNERHYAIAKWIVDDIRRMGYVFNRMPLSRDLYLPVKTEAPVSEFYPRGMTKEEKMKFLWSEVNRINKKYKNTL